MKVKPAIFGLCEAKEYGYWGEEALHKAEAIMSEHFSVPYQGRLGVISRGDFGPMFFFDPTRLALTYWGNEHGTVPDDKRNLAGFRAIKSGKMFEMFVEHWDFRSGLARMPYAERIRSYGRKNVPVLVMGDLNETASGLHLPQIDWAKAPDDVREHKGEELPDGTWQAHTKAVDKLIGRWNDQYRWGASKAGRLGGAGFHLLNELAARNGTKPRNAFVTTTVQTGLLIDMMLINDAWLRVGGLERGTFRIVGLGDRKWPSDHYLTEAVLTL